MGRAGHRLHLPSLAKVRDVAPGLLAPVPIVAFDPFRPPVADAATVDSLEDAARRCPPDRTVVHLCTPPHVRAAMLDRLAGLGYRKIIVEKPLAVDLVGLAAIARIRRRWGLDITVATHWLDSALTRRLRTAVAGRRFGELRGIRVVQNKPRFTRAPAPTRPRSTSRCRTPSPSPSTSPGLLRVVDASWDDLVIGDHRAPRLGRARLRLAHRTGVRTEIDSDLTSPVRERRITLDFDDGVLIGHYPCSDADHTAQLRTVRPGGEATWTAFDDDAFPAFLGRTYERYATTAPAPHGTLPLQVDAVRLLTEAKRLCAGVPEVRGVG
ncbi:oxidoreductase [Actinomadura sp. CNU-125]|uniref:oxidoreductase n=1 Tax=Actinomadura sp. CNU-125 TaxID=1904961 RepID=UPI0021CC9AB4|nr:oxidoreductase [Actinomadura sp. CNU-125]